MKVDPKRQLALCDKQDPRSYKLYVGTRIERVSRNPRRAAVYVETIHCAAGSAV